MGCLFSNCRSSMILKSESMPPNSCVQRLDQTNTNGIRRVPKLNLGNHDAAPDARNDRGLLRMKPPPPAPPPSPPRSVASPRPTLRAPSSPEDERIIEVEYTDDHRPASPKQSNLLEVSKGYKHSSITVSDVNIRPASHILKRTSSTRREEELSIEELDTDIDEYSRLRMNRNRNSKRFNPPITDILLPRRKDENIGPKKEKPKTKRKNVMSDNSNKNKENPNGIIGRRNDTPIPQHIFSKYEKNSKPDKSTKINIIQEDTEKNINADEMITIADEACDNKNNTETEHIISKRDMLQYINANNMFSSKTNIADKVRDTNIKHPIDKPGTPADFDSQIDSKSVLIAAPIVTPKKMYDKEMERKRQNRKRKHGTNNKNEYIPGKVDDKENLTSSYSTLKDRSDSVTSKWHLDSKQSFGSNATLNSFDMETTVTCKADRYSYIRNSSTPITFRALTMDFDGEEAEIIDLEDDNDDPNNTTWLEDENYDKDKQIDAWYGVKPYEVLSSTGEKDSGVITEIAREPSSSDIVTKKKLLYSRFSRRPHSETLLRGLGKPPLPPGAMKKTRPVSDTGQRSSNGFSRYYTTDLDIH